MLVVMYSIRLCGVKFRVLCLLVGLGSSRLCCSRLLW